MNLFLDYQKKIFKSVKFLEKNKLIKIPEKIKSFTVELPPKNQKGDLSCNAALVLAKENKKSPLDIANFLKPLILKKIDGVGKDLGQLSLETVKTFLSDAVSAGYKIKTNK